VDRSGFGLGLAIAQQALHAHGGNISVRDRPGVGCTFIVELPASAPAESSPKTAFESAPKA
jgi:signal transduction histidine kinase